MSKSTKMIKECEICINSFPIDCFEFLPCFHKLCIFCYNDIKKNNNILKCPFCRNESNESNVSNESNISNESNESNLSNLSNESNESDYDEDYYYFYNESKQNKKKEKCKTKSKTNIKNKKQNYSERIIIDY